MQVVALSPLDWASVVESVQGEPQEEQLLAVLVSPIRLPAAVLEERCRLLPRPTLFGDNNQLRFAASQICSHPGKEARVRVISVVLLLFG